MKYFRIAPLAFFISSPLVMAEEGLTSPQVTDEVGSEVSAGLGLGIPYGFLGGNVAVNLGDKVDLSAGLGAGLDTAYSFGVRFFPKETSKLRVSVLYGTNAYLEESTCDGDYYEYSCELDYEGYQGLNIGIGAGPRAGERGWNFDALFILTTGLDDEVDRLEEQGYDVEADRKGIQIAVGYQWAL